MSTQGQIWYRSRLQSVKWAKIKKLVLLRDEYICSVKGCNKRKNLEFHHVSYDRLDTIFEVDDIRIVCHLHHRRCHWRFFKKIPLTSRALRRRYIEVKNAAWRNINLANIINQSFYKLIEWYSI